MCFLFVYFVFRFPWWRPWLHIANSLKGPGISAPPVPLPLPFGLAAGDDAQLLLKGRWWCLFVFFFHVLWLCWICFFVYLFFFNGGTFFLSECLLEHYSLIGLLDFFSMKMWSLWCDFCWSKLYDLRLLTIFTLVKFSHLVATSKVPRR